MKVNINWDKFDSNLYRPLVNMDIPKFNPGTISYDDFWDEQDRRCLEGWKPKPFMPKITNEHYFYLNMCQIELLEKGGSRKTKGSPFYRELDRRLFDEISQAKKNRYGLIVGKPRRVGLSWVGSCTSTYELKFYQGGKVGVAAGQDDKAQDFYEKVKYLLSNIRKEYKSGIITKNSGEIKLGYEYTENKQKEEGGLLSQMFMKTMYAKPTGFEGKTLSLAIFEEAGLFEDIIAAYKSTEPCFKEGSIQFGTPLIYGTGGEIDKGSKGYKTMWSNPEKYNLKKVFVSSVDYYPGDGVPDKKTGKIISFFDFRTGRTNSKMALDYIIEERKIKEGSEGFIKHIQSYPLKEADIFIKNSGGLLDRKKINAQLHNLENNPFLYKKGRLEWFTKDEETIKLAKRAKNLKEVDKIHFNRKSKVVLVEDEEFGTYHQILDPIDTTKMPYNPNVQGTDSYDDDIGTDKKDRANASEGASMTYRCFYGVGKPHDLPTSYVLDRGSSDENDYFYSQTLRQSVFHNTENLIEHTKVAIIQYYKDVGAYVHLKGRPEIAGYNSNAKNVYGFKMPNQHAFNLVTRLLKAEVKTNFGNIWFENVLLQLLDWGESNSDLGSAYGMVLVSKLDMFPELTDGMEDADDDYNAINDMSYYAMENGSLVLKTYGNKDDDPYSISNMKAFDPEEDLKGEEYEAYQESKIVMTNKAKNKQNEILEAFGNDVMAFTLNQVHKKIDQN